eukprot:GHRQ01019922.1.p1 GENE.GHRQ01019922.1~~GHRQ01019922.1.p1  ORF type:complete len:186 (-),score=11.99 GHRQ01019922.1:742-1299(-)
MGEKGSHHHCFHLLERANPLLDSIAHYRTLPARLLPSPAQQSPTLAAPHAPSPKLQAATILVLSFVVAHRGKCVIPRTCSSSCSCCSHSCCSWSSWETASSASVHLLLRHSCSRSSALQCATQETRLGNGPWQCPCYTQRAVLKYDGGESIQSGSNLHRVMGTACVCENSKRINNIRCSTTAMLE